MKISLSLLCVMPGEEAELATRALAHTGVIKPLNQKRLLTKIKPTDLLKPKTLIIVHP